MRNSRRTVGAMTALLAFSALGAFAAMPSAAQADDVPIVVGKPIITKDPPKPTKGDGEVFVKITGKGTYS